MAVFVAVSPNAQVNGETVKSIIDGISFKSTAIEILTKHGLNKPRPGMWYSQQYWLNAIKEISERFLPPTLHAIGSKFAANVNLPPKIRSLRKALASIGAVYQVTQFVAEGKTKYKGTAYYKLTTVNKKEARIICQNPHPCEFDAGVIGELAVKYQPARGSVRVMHNDAAPCRKKGAESCEYIVKW